MQTAVEKVLTLGLYSKLVAFCSHHNLAFHSQQEAVLWVLACGQAHLEMVCQAPAGLLQASVPQGV